MKILIVDDEPPARSRLRALVGEAASGAEALRQVESLGVQMVLLDIRMPGMDGIEVARHLDSLETPPAVIFTTAYDSHALAAFEANAVDYLLKPIRRTRLATALARARALTRVQLSALSASEAQTTKARTHVSATLNGSLKLVAVADVRFFRAGQKYVTAVHDGGELLLDDTLTALEAEFGDRFLRVHRNALIAPQFATALEKDTGGRTCVRLRGVDDLVEVSRRMLATVRRVLRSG